MRILVTGGTGYIGSHACVALVEAGHKVVVIDNLSNSNRDVVDRLENLVGCPIPFVEGDIRNEKLLREVLRSYNIEAVFHFAGLKSVGESVAYPLDYYENNVGGSFALFSAMSAEGVKSLVFSSSASVYGVQSVLPIAENSILGLLTNPYAKSKLMVEQVLDDLLRADNSWRIACLRYFNPVGAHKSGRIGEDPKGEPNNLMAYIAQVAIGRRSRLYVYGNDYETLDGTGVRDYIHVLDLVDGHVAALNYINNNFGKLTVNLGTGNGYSVLEMIKSFECAAGRSIPFELVARRVGDVAASWADISQAKALLGWEAKRNIDEMCIDTWRWSQLSQCRSSTDNLIV